MSTARPAAVKPAAQNAPTKPMARDANGRILDADGLPISGPARARILAERNGAAAHPEMKNG